MFSLTGFSTSMSMFTSPNDVFNFNFNVKSKDKIKNRIDSNIDNRSSRLILSTSPIKTNSIQPRLKLHDHYYGKPLVYGLLVAPTANALLTPSLKILLEFNQHVAKMDTLPEEDQIDFDLQVLFFRNCIIKFFCHSFFKYIC